MATLGKDSDREVCRALAPDDADRSAMDLLKAAAQGDEGLVSTLMKQGADPSYQAGHPACTALNMHVQLNTLATLHLTPDASMLTTAVMAIALSGTLQRACSDMRTSLQDEKGRNALMEAAAKGHDSAVTLLLAAGTPWNAIDKEGSCAGDLAVAAGHESTAEILLDAGRIFSSHQHQSAPRMVQ